MIQQKFVIINKYYSVNPEKKTVVCFIKGFFQKNIDGFKHYEEPGSFVGIAKCYHSDIFDEIKGKRIAESKAYIKMHRNLIQKMNKDYVNYNKSLKSIELDHNKRVKILTKEIAHLNKLINK